MVATYSDQSEKQSPKTEASPWDSLPGIDEAIQAQENLPQEEPGEFEMGQKGETKALQVKKLLELAGVRITNSPSGSSYASYRTGAHLETRSTEDPEFRRWLVRKFLEVKDSCLSQESLKDGVFLASAHTEEAQQEPHIRVAGDPDEILLDLGLPSWEMVRITSDGWSLEPYRGKPLIVRPQGSLPLPYPDREGTLEALRPFVNGSREEFVKVCGFLLASLHPSGPYPVLLISGSQGSAKSTLSRFLVRLIDNRVVTSADLPQKPEEFPVIAQHFHVLNFDNVSHISTDISNSLCRLSTGGGLAKRRLYTDGELSAFGGRRPCILNGIGGLASRGDLVDRAVFLNLDKLHNFATEEALEKRWEASAPLIMGGLLNALVGCIKGREGTRLAEKPRMLDAVLWVEGAALCGRAPWKNGEFAELMTKNKDEADMEILENDMVASFLMEEMALNEKLCMKPTELRRRIFEYHRDSETRRLCPHSTQLLHKKLEELSPILHRAGIAFKRTRIYNAHYIEFWKIPAKGQPQEKPLSA